MLSVSQIPLAVIGAGAWGTVLAALLARNGHRVTLWARRESLVREMQEHGENRQYLSGFKLPHPLSYTTDPAEAIAGAEAAFFAVPSKGWRSVLERFPTAPAYVSCAKGLEVGSFQRPTQVIAEYAPDAVLAALSGPNLAREIAAGLPAAATVASAHEPFAHEVQRWLTQPSFRVYTSFDLIGVEVSGAMKNVIALAAGLCDGLGLGDNAKASILTRGLSEIVRLGERLGGERETFFGLSGLGDMVATCNSAGSRNHEAGERIALGETRADLERSGLNAEGIPTVRAVVAWAEGVGLELPIASEVYRVVFEGKAPLLALDDLMARETRAEW